jgi:hypothetical protein
MQFQYSMWPVSYVIQDIRVDVFVAIAVLRLIVSAMHSAFELRTCFLHVPV